MKNWNWQKKIFLRSIFFLLLILNNAKSENFITGYAKVSDGDTIKISKYKIRLHGIDAPEMKQICERPYLKIGFFTITHYLECIR